MPHAEEYTEFTPERYPPFPEEPGFPTVELETISLKKFLDKDAAEQDRVFEACKVRGFFYLDLDGCAEGDAILHGANNLGRVAERTFKLPAEEKEKYPYGSKDIFGYKKANTSQREGVVSQDHAEFFNVPKNEMIVPEDQMQRPWPSTIMKSQALFANYSATAHKIGMTFVEFLAVRLGIDPEEMKKRHIFERQAGDVIRMTRGPPRDTPEMPEVQTPSHTDFGTITILMNWLGGLQVWSNPSRSMGPLQPDTPGEWLWVKPKKGCAIVNLGDAMVKFTNSVLCSGRHRVVPAPGVQGTLPRYSMVYFVRPNDDCKLKTLKGKGVPPADDQDEEGINAKEWVKQQAEILRNGGFKK